jgi:hypothetical protein
MDPLKAISGKKPMQLLASELEFLKRLWGLGTEEEEGYRTGPPEPVFLNVHGAQESIPRNEFHQPM